MGRLAYGPSGHRDPVAQLTVNLSRSIIAVSVPPTVHCEIAWECPDDSSLCLERERPHLRPLPPAPVPEYVNYRVRVRRWSTIRVSNRTYSVPSRMIGMEVEVRLYADHIEVYYKGHLVESMERVHGSGEARIDYRHISGSLVRKPGAFARDKFREQMFPTQTFRLAYDAMRGWRGDRADVDYVRILHLATTTMESEATGGKNG